MTGRILCLRYVWCISLIYQSWSQWHKTQHSLAKAGEKKSSINHLLDASENKSRLCRTSSSCLGNFLSWDHFLASLRAWRPAHVGAIMVNNAACPFTLQATNLESALHVLCGRLNVWCGSWGFHGAHATPRADSVSSRAAESQEIGLHQL